MPQVGAAELTAGITITAVFDGPEIRLKGARFDADRPLAREACAVARHARGQDAVEHVNAARHQLHQLRRCAQAHRVTRQMRRQEWLGHIDRLEDFRFRLAYTHPADGVTVKSQRYQGLRALLAQRGVGATLHDAEKLLARSARLLEALPSPATEPRQPI